MSKGGFLGEWSDGKDTNKFLLLAGLSFLIVLLWVNVSLEHEWSGVFLFMLLIPLAFGFIDQLNENNALGISFAGFGKDYPAFTMALIAGAVAGFILVGPANLSVAHFAVVSGDSLSRLYVTIASPFVEEIFFSGFLFFTLASIMKNKATAALVTCVLFGGFHLVAYGGDLPSIFVSMIFRAVCIFGNGYFKSLGFGWAIHAVNNGVLA